MDLDREERCAPGSSHLPPSEASKMAKPVTFPLGAVEPRDDTAGDGVGRGHKDDRDRPGLSLEGKGRRGPDCQDDVGLQAHQFLRERSYPIDVTAVPPKVHPHVATIGPTQVREPLRERREAKLPLRIVFIICHEHADARYAVALLRSCRKRPCDCRAAEPRDEISPVAVDTVITVKVFLIGFWMKRLPLA
jgi:hypothetical protein